jgi:glycosyltransferase involved in cell wall biosynthesis
MRIGIYFRSRTPGDGGSFTYITAIINELNSTDCFVGHELCFITDSPPVWLKNESSNTVLITNTRVASIKTRIFEKLRSVGFKFNFMEEYRPLPSGFLKKNKIEFVWSLEPGSGEFETPYATTIWDLEHRKNPHAVEFSEGKFVRNRESAISKTLQEANIVFVGSIPGVKEVHNYYPSISASVKLLPFPINKQESSQCVRAKNTVFYPAQFWSHKNHAVILDALAETKNSGNEPFKIIFTGADKGSLEILRSSVEELGLTEYVFFEGLVSLELLHHFYRTSTVMVYPSLFGPDNLPPLEALSFNCPTFVADIPGAREIYFDHVTYFDPHSPQALAELLKNHFNSLTSMNLKMDDALANFLENRSPKNVVKLAELSILAEILPVL